MADDCHKLHYCCERPPSSDRDDTSLADLTFLVMASSRNRDRAIGLRKSWAAQLSSTAAGNNNKPNQIWLFSDAADTETGAITTPDISGKESYDDAQYRSTKGAQWLMKTHPEVIARTKWFVFVDDDTWIEPSNLVTRLQSLEWRLPLAMGYLWRAHLYLGYAHFSGGAGVVISKECFMRSIPLLFDPQYWNGLIDTSLSRVMSSQKCLFLHSEQFMWDSGPLRKEGGGTWFTSDGKSRLYNSVLSAISGHYIKPDEMSVFSKLAREHASTLRRERTPLRTAHNKR